MKKILLILLVLYTNISIASEIDDINAVISAKLNLNSETLAWLLAKSDTYTTVSVPIKRWQQNLSFIPWQYRELEAKDYVSILVCNDGRVDWFTYNIIPTEKSIPILNTRKETPPLTSKQISQNIHDYTAMCKSILYVTKSK